MEARNTDLIDEWFELDDNAVPKQYVLKPITSVYENYSNMEEPKLRKEALDEWNAVCDILTTLLRNAAEYAYTNGKFSVEKRHKYFRSGKRIL